MIKKLKNLNRNSTLPMKKNTTNLLKLNHMYKMALKLKEFNIHTELIKKIIHLCSKFLIKIPVHIKRSICLKCYRIRVPNLNCKTEIVKKNKIYSLVVKCMCGYIKIYKLA